MRRFVIVCSFLIIGFGGFAQPKHTEVKTKTIPALDSAKRKVETEDKKALAHKKLTLTVDTLTYSDYMMSIDRVNDNLNTIRDSAKLGFEVIGMGRRIDYITNDVKIIRQNIRDKRLVVNIKNLYLYQSFTNSLDDENDALQARLMKMYHRVYYAKVHLKTVMSDSVFRRLYADSILRNKFDDKLLRLERKWSRSDSTTKANIDSLNVLKVKMTDNSINLANMSNMLNVRLDKAGALLFGPEVNCLWQKEPRDTLPNDPSKSLLNKLDNKQKVVGYYFSQTSRERIFILVLGVLLFVWLFFKRKLLKTIKTQKETFSFLNLQYFNQHPGLSVFLLLLCLLPFFDAYAPSSYIAIEYLLLLLVATVIFFRRDDHSMRIHWLALLILFVANTITYLFADPTLFARLIMLALQTGTIVFSFRYYKNLHKQASYYSWIRTAAVVAIILSILGIFCNLFGRFSLSGIFGVAGVFAVTQAIILPVFIETILEILLLQLQNSRLKKGVDKPFDCSVVVKKIKGPLGIVALLLWFFMLTSNLNIYHNISSNLVELLTTTRNIGSISFEFISVIMFFAIIWVAHILQQLISFFFGETGSEIEDVTSDNKGQHSRLLIMRLLVLIGGYLLAIAASGLPIDKLTFLLGALGVGIGMGLQNIVNNFVSGIILIFDGTLKLGDEIEVNGQAGKVKEIGLRASTLSTSDGADVIIPNGNILSQNIVNWTFSNDQKRIVIEFSLAGKELDANMVNELINSTIKNIPNVVSQKLPVILYTKVSQESYSITVRFWGTIANADQVRSQAMLKLSAAFASKSIGFE